MKHTAGMILCGWLCAVLVAWSGQALAFEEIPAVAKIFAAHKVGNNGTFVMYAPKTSHMTGHNAKRAATRFVPASTFKIANSLIGLSRGAVADVDTVFYRHDGKPKALKAWERDMNLREGIKVSCVPAYQELARRIGLETMQQEVRRIGYGNANIGTEVDTFWLKGPLAVSAQEQTEFLARLALERLPYPVAAQRAVRDICKLESGNDWTLYGKTGLAVRDKARIGWFVGWVERKGQIFAFALNMDMPKDADLALRVNLVKESLRAIGVLEKS